MKEEIKDLKKDNAVNITLAKETSHAEVVLRYGEAPAQLEPKAPIKLQLHGALNTPAEFLSKRLETGQFDISRCNLKVDRENVRIMLTINEDDEYNVGAVTGMLEFDPDFKEMGINQKMKWTPVELGMFFKMNRHLFKDKAENMRLVTELMNFTASINNKVERTVKENGSNADNFAQVVNSNLPASFKVYMPIFKGGEREELEIETFANLDGREVSFLLISPGAVEVLEETRNVAIDKELEGIRKIAPELVIIEV